MKIGITERGDAGVNYAWTNKLDTVNGVILITKDINEKFQNEVMKAYRNHKNIIIHATTTGWGSTIMEPNVPDYKTQLNHLNELINKGFPKDHCVLRIDPIFPTSKGLKRVDDVIAYAKEIGLLPGLRIRISILDEYKHVRDRFIDAGFRPMYDYAQTAPPNMISDVKNSLAKHTDLVFETCAEPDLLGDNIHPSGCVSQQDLDLFGLQLSDMVETNGQNRLGCLCLAIKDELLNNKHPCKHQCLYCYWK